MTLARMGQAHNTAILITPLKKNHTATLETVKNARGFQMSQMKAINLHKKHFNDNKDPWFTSDSVH